MILKELLKQNTLVYSATESARLSQVAEMMRDKHIGCVVIVNEFDQAIGIVTDRDIALVLALGAATPDSFVGEVMSRDVKTINESMTLMDATHFIRTLDVKRLPVVNDQNQVVAIISTDDVISILSRHLFDTCKSLEPKLGHFA